MATNIKENTMILHSTVENHDCDPEMDCKECKGTGNCTDCNGQGEETCEECHGNGRCKECHGKGSHKCKKCGGRGQCTNCHGSGEVRCHFCNGTGSKGKYNNRLGYEEMVTCWVCHGSGVERCPKCTSMFSTKRAGLCPKCEGTGEITCKKCDGSGDCQNCHGTGKITCKTCDGSGECQNCDGSGKVTCERCEGTGVYQTYLVALSNDYAKSYIWTKEGCFSNAVCQATGKKLYSGVYENWKTPLQCEFSNFVQVIEKVKNEADEHLGMQVKEFVSDFSNSSDQKPDSNNDKVFRKQMALIKVPSVTINYFINGKDYSLKIFGDNNVVALNDIPNKIDAFHLPVFQQLILALTEKKRLKAYATLAAYIFGVDGWTPSEYRVINCIIQELGLQGQKIQQFEDKLQNIHSTNNNDEIIKKIKPILKSKKTISFAWQCMNVDKSISQPEEQLFQQITSQYKDLTEEEIENYKNMAHRFKKLEDSQIIKEYADVKPSYKNKRKAFWYGIITLAASAGGAVAICL